VYFIALPAWLAIINQDDEPFAALGAALRYSTRNILQLLGLSVICLAIFAVSILPLALLVPFAAPFCQLAVVVAFLSTREPS
jgi:hypothetical protein